MSVPPVESAGDPLRARVDAFVAEPHAHWVDGAPLASDGPRLDVEDPATGRRLASVPAGTAVDADRAVASARAAFDDGRWHRLPPSRRERVLLAVADLIERDAAFLTAVEVADNGMPVATAGRVSPVLAARYFRYYAGWVTKLAGQVLPSDPPPFGAADVLAYTRREPVGVVAAIIPWNVPLLMAALKIAPALAAGCTVVLKPAELAPLAPSYLMRLLDAAGVPPGVVNLVHGAGDPVGAALVAHPDVDKVSFTGSTDVGRAIVRAATGNLKKVTLELGGKSPMIVMPDADLDQAIGGCLRSAYFLTGQNCQCGSRIFVHERVHDRVLEGLVAGAARLKVGPGHEPDTIVGPLISARQRERVETLVASGREQGATVAAGGARLDGTGYFYAPTVFADVEASMRIVREEIFGPVTCVQRFADDDLDAIARQANDTAYGLAASVWTRDVQVAHRLAHRLKAGLVGINMHGIADVTLPFGGYKASGWGREFGPEGLEPYLETKTVTLAL